MKGRVTEINEGWKKVGREIEGRNRRGRSEEGRDLESKKEVNGGTKERRKDKLKRWKIEKRRVK